MIHGKKLKAFSIISKEKNFPIFREVLQILLSLKDWTKKDKQELKMLTFRDSKEIGKKNPLRWDCK